MTKEFIAALTVFALFVGAAVLFLCKLAFSGVRRPKLEESFDREMQRQKRMARARNQE